MEDDSHRNGANVSITRGSPDSPCSKSTNNSSSNNNNNNKEQDRFLPIANVGRIMKKVLPANGKISKDAKETVQECVSEFISFVTGEASDKCQREKRKTINGDDIIWAITTLGFEDYVGPLKLYLSKYREIEGEKLNIPKQQRPEQQQQQQRLHQQQDLDQQQLQQQQQQQQSLTPPYNSVYSATSLMSQAPPFVTTADHQAFSLTFSPNSIQKQLQQHDQIDSIGQW